MARAVMIPWQGRPTEAEQLDFDPRRESWQEYGLEDGTRLRVRCIVRRVVRLPEYNERGEPIYLVESANVVDADVPPELMRKG